MATKTITAGTTNGGLDRTITIYIEAEKTKADTTISDACRWVYSVKGLFHLFDEQDPPQVIPYDSLTAGQQLSLWLSAIIYFTKHWATSKYTNEQTALTQDEIAAEASEKYSLES